MTFSKELVAQTVQSSIQQDANIAEVREEVLAHTSKVMRGEIGDFPWRRELQAAAGQRQTRHECTYRVPADAWKHLDTKGLLQGKIPQEVLPSVEELKTYAPEDMRPLLETAHAFVLRDEHGDVMCFRFRFDWTKGFNAEMVKKRAETPRISVAMLSHAFQCKNQGCTHKDPKKYPLHARACCAQTKKAPSQPPLGLG